MLTLKILQKFTKKTSIDELLFKIENSEAKISHSLFNKSASTSNKERGWEKIHHSHHGFSSVFFVVKMKIDI